ncbi:glycosyltransferase family 4 protein [bacterium]|nr:glycosyltransferase family 4 protein [bacterium]
MRILFIYNVSYFFCLHRLHLAKKLIKDGHDVWLICKIESEEDRELLWKSGVKLSEMTMSRGFKYAFKDIKSWFDLRKLIKEIGPDLTEVATVKPIVVGGLIFIMNRMKVVYWLPGLGYIFTSQSKVVKGLRFILMKIYKMIFMLSDCKVILENSEDRDFLIAKGVLPTSDSFVLSGSCVTVEEYSHEREPREFKVALISRMLWNKGIGEYIDAIRIFRKNPYISCEFLLVGMTDDNPTSIPVENIKQWVKEGLITYTGFVKDVRRIYEDVNIVCLPSHREGLPKVIVEAGASTRASIVTNVPGCREIIRDGFNGKIVTVGDPKDLANSIEFLLTNEATRLRMAKNARQYVEEKFSTETFYQSIEKIYFR